MIEYLHSGAEGDAGNMRGADIARVVNGLINETGSLSKDATHSYHADGTTDDRSNLSDALNYSAPGTTVTLPQGATLRIAGNIFVDLKNNVGGNRIFNMNGATLVFDNEDDGIVFHGGWSEIQGFDGVGTSTVTGCDDASKFRRHDYVRIISDDHPNDSWKSSAWNHDDLFVESISGSTLNCAGYTNEYKGIDSQYLTNRRVCQRSGFGVTVYNGKFTQGPNVVGTQANLGMLALIATTDSLVYNVEVKECVNAGIESWCNIHAKFIACKINTTYDKSFDSAPWKAFGYGIIDASYNTVIMGCSGHRNRHFIDTSDHSYGTNRVPEQYGGSTGLTVIGCVGTGTTNSTFSTHHTARGVRFIDCLAVGSHDFGYGIRGDVTLHNCVSNGCSGDINIFDESRSGQSPDADDPCRTWLKAYNHVAICSGKITNANYHTAAHFWNYTARDSKDSSGHFITHREETETYFHGTTTIKPLNAASYNSIYGGHSAIEGTVYFDKMIWDLDNLETTTSNSCALFENRSGNAKLIGEHMHIHGTLGNSVIFESEGENNDDHFQFILTTDSAPNYSGSGALKVAANEDWGSIGLVEPMSISEYRRGIRTPTFDVTVNLGSSVSDGDTVTGTVDIAGYDVDVQATATSASDIRIENIRRTAKDRFTVRATNVSGGTLNLSSTQITVCLRKLK